MHNTKTKPGDRWGYLTVIRYIGRPKEKWECKCDCGNIVYKNLSALKGQKSAPSCGCRKEHPARKAKIGDRYGNLTVVSYIKNPKAPSKSIIECICDCGNTTNRCYADLNKTKSPSCGCNRSLPDQTAHKNLVFYHYKKRAKKYNVEFLIDRKTFENLISKNCFYCSVPPSNRISESNPNPFYYNGLDRVDNTKGYTSENCVPCCKVCNIAKNDRSYTQYIEWIKTSYKVLIERK